MAELSLVEHLFDVIEYDVVPKAAEGVTKGTKLFSAALLAKEDHSLVLIETNNELENPSWHGKMLFFCSSNTNSSLPKPTSWNLPETCSASMKSPVQWTMPASMPSTFATQKVRPFLWT